MSTDRDAHKEALMNALATVHCPEGGDLVSAGLIGNVAHCDGAVTVTLELPFSMDSADALRDRATEVLSKVSGVKQAKVKVTEAITSTPSTKEENPLASVKNIIAVASGKGGVGKSTIAVNLAYALMREGAKVGLLDADIYGPSIPTMLGQKSSKPRPVEGEDGKKLFGPIEAHGMKLMSMGFLVEEDRPVIWRGPMLHGALKQFFNDVAWGELDYLVLDLPPGTGDVALTMAQTLSLTGAVVVSTPQEVARVDARKAVRMFEETGIPVLGLVENMTGPIFGEGHVATWAESKDIPFLGSIPLEPEIRAAGDGGAPLGSEGDSKTAQAFAQLARQLALRVAHRNREAQSAPMKIEL